MNGKRNRSSRSFTRWAATAVLWVAGAGSALFAQNPVPPAVNTAAPTKTSVAPANSAAAAPTESGVVPAGCSSCSRGLIPDMSVLPTFSGGSCASCGGCGSCSDGCGGNCVPGRTPCDCCIDESTAAGRLLGGIYRCICCPDPCYEPKWNALADSAFFQDGARPVTQMRLRYESVWDYSFPDKAEFLWAKEGGKGPAKPAGRLGESAVSYQDLSLYNEVAIDRFSASIAIPYLQMEDNTFGGASGFGDMTIGTKSLLLDCELIQFAFALNTIVPIGNFTKGLGTGHVSLEPGLLMSLKLTPSTYLQADGLYRIPIGGDSAFQGPVLQYHLSLNHMLWECGSCNGIKLIGVAELNGFELLGGSFTDPVTGNPLSARDVGSVLSIGPGVRLVICDKIDFGVGSAFNLTHDSVGDEMVRVDFRWRF
jgi:hypothetical protein